jgi:hypothetical protein
MREENGFGRSWRTFQMPSSCSRQILETSIKTPGSLPVRLGPPNDKPSLGARACGIN